MAILHAEFLVVKIVFYQLKVNPCPIYKVFLGYYLMLNLCLSFLIAVIKMSLSY